MKPGHVESPQGLAVQSVCSNVIFFAEVVFSEQTLPLMVVSSSLILLRQVRFVRFNDRFETVLENAPILLGKRSDDHFLRPDS